MSDLEQKGEQLEKRNVELSNQLKANLDWIKNHQDVISQKLEIWARNYESKAVRSMHQSLRNIR